MEHGSDSQVRTGSVYLKTPWWVQVHLQEHGHLRLVQRLDGVLHQLGGVLQVLAVLPPQTSDVVQFLLLLRVDPQDHLTFPLLQQSEQVIERLTHLRLLSAAVLLKQHRADLRWSRWSSWKTLWVCLVFLCCRVYNYYSVYNYRWL